MPDTSEIWSSTSCKSSPTWSSCPNQTTTMNGNDDISFVLHRNELFFDALERRRRNLSFGFGPGSKKGEDHPV